MLNKALGEDQIAGQKAEELFQKYCDDANITYLYVDQKILTKSSAIIRDLGQRPDFLVIEPNKMPFFVDVKTHKFVTKEGELNYFYGDKDNPAIFWSNNEYQKLLSFQSLVGIPIWVSFFERRGKSDVDPQFMYVIPLNVAGRFLRQGKNKYFFQIPRSCCTLINNKKPVRLSHELCLACEKKYCDKVDELLESKKD